MSRGVSFFRVHAGACRVHGLRLSLRSTHVARASIPDLGARGIKKDRGVGGKDAGFACRENQPVTALINFWTLGGSSLLQGIGGTSDAF
jgi:hypothetical protein